MEDGDDNKVIKAKARRLQASFARRQVRSFEEEGRNQGRHQSGWRQKFAAE